MKRRLNFSKTPVPVQNKKGEKAMKKYEAEQIAERIKTADEWNADDCSDLCELAGLEKEWEEADGESFEAVVYRAAEILDVEI